jgi:hypothetical protein
LSFNLRSNPLMRHVPAAFQNDSQEQGNMFLCRNIILIPRLSWRPLSFGNVVALIPSPHRLVLA